MSLEQEIRDEIAYRFLINGFRQVEAVTDWALEVYGDNEYIKKAKNPRNLIANVMGMGGEGDQKQMNMTAHGHAFARYEGECKAQERAEAKQIEEANKAESIRQARENNVLRDKLEKAQQDYQDKLEEKDREVNEVNAENRMLRAKVNGLEKEKITLQLTGSVEMPDALKAEATP